VGRTALKTKEEGDGTKKVHSKRRGVKRHQPTMKDPALKHLPPDGQINLRREGRSGEEKPTRKWESLLKTIDMDEREKKSTLLKSRTRDAG